MSDQGTVTRLGSMDATGLSDSEFRQAQDLFSACVAYASSSLEVFDLRAKARRLRAEAEGLERQAAQIVDGRGAELWDAWCEAETAASQKARDAVRGGRPAPPPDPAEDDWQGGVGPDTNLEGAR